MKNRAFHHRLVAALRGLRDALARERSARTQVFVCVALALAVAWLRPPPVWCALLALACGGVLGAELLNTALERLADHLHPELHPEIGRAKDCAAAAVLICTLAALAVGVACAVALWRGR